MSNREYITITREFAIKNEGLWSSYTCITQLYMTYLRKIYKNKVYTKYSKKGVTVNNDSFSSTNGRRFVLFSDYFEYFYKLGKLI